MCGIVAVNRTGWWWRSVSCYIPSKAHVIPTTWSVAIVLVLKRAWAGGVTSSPTRRTQCVRCRLLPPSSSCGSDNLVPCSNLQRSVCEKRIFCGSALQTARKRGMCSSISLRRTPIVLLPLHLPAGVRHDAEQLAWNCPVGRRRPGFDAPQSRPEILQVVFSLLPPALPLCLLHSGRAAPSLCFISLHFRHSIAPVYQPSTHLWFRAWSSRSPFLLRAGDGVILSRRRNWGSSPPAPVVVAPWVPLLVIPHPRKGRGETTPSPS